VSTGQLVHRLAGGARVAFSARAQGNMSSVSGEYAERADAQRPRIEADGLLTAMPAAGLMVLTADCLPVALASSSGVAMLHAGWRGIAAGVLEQGVLALRRLAGGGPIHGLIGPGAGRCCYEVGPEVHAALGGAGRGHGPVDLPAIARERLLASGVTGVETLGICTICDRRYFSHRREGARAGRQAAVAWRA
jgi:copper oxidase (laccase) domain-containing protein